MKDLSYFKTALLRLKKTKKSLLFQPCDSLHCIALLAVLVPDQDRECMRRPFLITGVMKLLVQGG